VVVGVLVMLHSVAVISLAGGLISSTSAEALFEDGLIIKDTEIREIIAQPTVYRQIPRIRFAGDRRTYEFLADHPPLSNQIARRLYPQLEGYTITQVQQGVFTIQDRNALRGEARLIAATDDQRIYRFQGEFRSLAHLIRFTGRMVVIFRYREVRNGSDTFIDSEPNFYLRIDHLFFHYMAKLLSPPIRSIVDRRVKTIVEATHKLFDQVRTDPGGLYKQMSTWGEVQPADLEAFRQAFLGKEAVTR
jgi:hypothetical protein